MADRPTEAEIAGFLDDLRAYRATISARHQEMLDVMVLGAIKRRASAEEEAEVKAFWAAFTPASPTVGYPGGPAGGAVLEGLAAAIW